MRVNYNLLLTADTKETPKTTRNSNIYNIVQLYLLYAALASFLITCKAWLAALPLGCVP